MEKLTLYAVKYCPCIYESAFAIESLHRTKAGAYKALRVLLESAYEDWRSRGRRSRFSFKPFEFEAFKITPIEVED